MHRYHDLLTGALAGHVTGHMTGHVTGRQPAITSTLSEHTVTADVCRQLTSVCRQLDVACQHADTR